MRVWGFGVVGVEKFRVSGLGCQAQGLSFKSTEKSSEWGSGVSTRT